MALRESLAPVDITADYDKFADLYLGRLTAQPDDCLLYNGTTNPRKFLILFGEICYKLKLDMIPRYRNLTFIMISSEARRIRFGPKVCKNPQSHRSLFLNN